MRSSFSGFEVAYKALNANQKALDVVSQNISNVNTKGYTRQRISLSSIAPYSGGIYDSINIKAGGGVNIDGITQLRDKFLDIRFRNENANNNTINSFLEGLREIESVIDETAINGLGSAISEYYSSLQNYSLNTANVESASLLRSAARKLTQSLNINATQLNKIKQQKTVEFKNAVNEVNHLLDKLKEINISIKAESVTGKTPNEMLDKRNLLLDELSEYINITVEQQEDHTVTIKSSGTYLLDSQLNLNYLSVDEQDGKVSLLNKDGTALAAEEGKLFGLLNIINGDSEDIKGVQYYLNLYDSFAEKFADTFNNLNSVGGTDKPLFTGDNGEVTASNITISSQWENDPFFITSSAQTPDNIGKNDNILLMLQAFNTEHSFNNTFTSNFLEFTTLVNNDIATDISFYEDVAKTSDLVLNTIADKRESITGVSIDEETINLLKYQKAYAAAARVMTTFDDMLDIIINRMGV